MQRIAAFGRLTGCADVEPVGDGNMHMLIGAFGYATAYDGKVFFLVTARCMRINERRFARFQIAIANNAGFHVVGGHTSPVCNKICFQTAVSSNNVHSRRSLGWPATKAPNSAWLMPMI